jgi:membrane associated rhomboid family serine protease
MPVVSRSASVTYSLGPGYPTPAVKQLLIVTIAAFLLQYIGDFIAVDRDVVGRVISLNSWAVTWLGLTPARFFTGFLWQPVSYLFLHADILHVAFNMLALWMFGVDLERRWGRTAFLRYYFVCGIGAALTVLLVSLLPFAAAAEMYRKPTIGASGAIYGLLLAYGMLFPHRTIFLMVFPVPARVYVIIVGVIVLLQASGGGGGGIAHFAHLGGLVAGYLYLSMGRGGGLWAEIKYRYVKWRMNRLRKRFDVHDGGRRWDSRVH